ncbi:hypothetical protein SAMN00120144_2529 [Hymenobacter roseosalivarius DSM 11622]|uniref:Uncharacterized protein n=1 Tax=Hymenobacter roseosalivarius DSM 11622 TaxID=645990 RepID=A0A1W1W3T8_9BACT|nr:hypothetical protein SAMN00120144_2529 [Hymenobacter roseosalivarius DSM 11622]
MCQSYALVPQATAGTANSIALNMSLLKLFALTTAYRL